MKSIEEFAVCFAVFFGLVVQSHCQINPNFTSAAVTEEKAIRLSWASTNREIYQIQYAEQVVDTNVGTTLWQTLYDDYPSQGTNTLWLDTGNYSYSPPILHPKKTAMRFYRILDKGIDTTNEPSVSITSPTNGALVNGELTVTVAASTDQPLFAGTKLYVNGQEMRMADSTTNYTVGSTNHVIDTYHINTCEWPNGTNFLFATVECESGWGDSQDSGSVASGHAVSMFIPVFFNNLVTKVAFSESSFDPSAGQTQEVSAVFAVNADWTLTIRDVFSNAVRTVTGSGTDLQFDWDGNNDGGTNLPNGIYYYYITAQTNSSSFSESMVFSGGSHSRLNNSVTLADSDEPTESWVLPFDGSGAPAPLQIYPPGFDTNGWLIIQASRSELGTLHTSFSSEDSLVPTPPGGGGSTGEVSSASVVYVSPLPTPQTVPPAPQRPPTNPVRGLAGTFGVLYDTYTGNGIHGYNPPALLDGSLSGLHITFGADNNLTPNFPPLPGVKTEANNFISEMEHGGWTNTLVRADDGFGISDMRGSGMLLNSVNLGVFLGHGTSGNNPDYFGGRLCKEIYFPITSGSSSAQYLRLAEMNLGNSATNGLKWAALVACQSLYHVNWSSMRSAGALPYNANLHLLLGADTDLDTSPTMLSYWARYMTFGTSTNYSPLTIRAAWYQAATDAYRYSSLPSGTVIKLVVAGSSACQNDTVQTNYTPTGSWFSDTPVQVYPPSP